MNFQQKATKIQAVLETFLTSEAYREGLIETCMHSLKWKYNHQTLWAKIHVNGTVQFPYYRTLGHTVTSSEGLVLIEQISTHYSRLELVSTVTSYEDILGTDVCREITESLYEDQKARLHERTLDHFAYSVSRKRLY